ncbi:MAG TPA: isoprenylcysteine carboxylmethyltransferase family protein [Candidatus Acidoferrum sp.]|jgi:protein-S-isoprenylcysteine O-methyltransferase Ste14|nr:isoprenylcysteine carboxylmethyltransferase family protein [Candidatus Acidoferrum sp.]
MNFNPDSALGLAWLVFWGYWLIARFSVNRMERPEPGGTLIVRVLIMAGAYWLLFQQDPRFGILNLDFVPHDERIVLAGVLLTWSGVAFAIWARYHLGKFWSATVVLREGHQLIRSGPYANIRHPIYTGMLTAVLGTTLAVGRYRALLAFIVILAAFTVKSRQEEKLLDAQFGPAFEQHRRDTGFFLPRLS